MICRVLLSPCSEDLSMPRAGIPAATWPSVRRFLLPRSARTAFSFPIPGAAAGMAAGSIRPGRPREGRPGPGRA